MYKNKEKIYILLFAFYVIIKPTQCKFGHRRDDGADVEDAELPVLDEAPNINDVQESDDDKHNGKGSCWIPLKGEQHFEKMNNLEQKYKDLREAYVKDIDLNHLDERMLDAMSKTRGIAERALQKFSGVAGMIPAGLNLGSNCMVRMPGSVLFFYRLKLRNNTRFVVNFLHNDLEQLTLTLRLSLNDLHLVGEYERALTTSADQSRLFYSPTKGGVEFLLKDVKYKVEGRYRLLGDRLHIEHIISEIPPMETLMRYTSDPEGQSVPMDPENIKDYLLRMKNDLDNWLKDYFNDFLMLYGVEEVKKNKKIQKYQNERMIQLNQYADQVIEILNKRLRKLGDADLVMPDFRLTAANGMVIKLFDGAVRNVDTMYRRSATTGRRDGEVRKVDADIGFSSLRVEYRYDTYTRTGVPPLSGMLVLNSDDVSAHMALQVVNQGTDESHGTEDLHITYLGYGKPEALTVEGPANRIIANFKHLLEHHIISIMTSIMIHHIRSLSNLVACEPNLHGKGDPEKDSSDDDDSNDDIKTPVTHKKDDDVTTPSTDSTEDVTTPSTDSTDDVTTPSTDSTDEVTTPSDSTDDVTTPSDSTDDVTTPSDSTDDVTTPSDSTDDVTTPSDSTDDATTPSDSTDDVITPSTDSTDDVTTPSTDSNDDVTTPSTDSPTDDSNEPKLDYAFEREESIELELPPKPGSAKGDTLKLNHNETFTLKKINDDESRRSGPLKSPEKVKGDEKIASVKH